MSRRRALLAAPVMLVPALLAPVLSPPGATAAPAAGPAAAALPPSAAPHAPAVATVSRHAVAVGTGGAVAAETPGATRAGLAVLKAGGNAVDAAVATAAALGVDDPFVAGPGGGGFMVIHLASGRNVTIDGRETCPATCTPRLFLDRSGKPLDFELARHSGVSVGVPGMVAQWSKAVRLYGRHSLAQDLQPAIRLARTGFRVDAEFRSTTQASLAQLQAFTSSRKLFLTKAGGPLPVGTLFRNPDLANTYTLLARNGPAAFYRGRIGAAVAKAVQHPPVAPQTDLTVLPGSMTTQDLRQYVAKSRTPTHVRYRGLDVYSMAPPSSGGTTVGEALNILSGWQLGSESRATALFHYLEASRLAFADRNAYVGDSDYEPVPVAALLDKQFAATRRCLVKGTALKSPVAPGDPFAPYSSSCSTGSAPAAPVAQEGKETNHLVTSDRWGNVVSYTNTIEQLAGSGITVPGHGFLLNNELTDFDFAPATPATYDPNLPAPGKRPRSSMSPTIVVRDGKPFLAVGSPGGSTIITTVLQTLVNRIDLGMTLPQAIAAPRANQSNSGATVVEPAFAAAPYASVLQRRYGETFSVLKPPADTIGFVNALEFLSGGRVLAATEPRRSGGGTALVVHPTP